MLSIKGGLIMKSKSVILGIILVLIIMLSGIGIGYFIYSGISKKINVEIQNQKKHSEDYMESCISVKINEKEITDEIGLSSLVSCKYEIFNNLVLLEVYHDVSGYSDLYIYNSKAEKMFDMSDIPTDLLILKWNFDKENQKIIFYSQLTEETGGVSDRVQEITGKDLWDLTCEELEYYKDKMIAMEKYEVILGNNKIESIKLVEKDYLEKYIDELNICN